jgi:hypothetical protein
VSLLLAALDAAPVTLRQAGLDQASGAFGDLDAMEILLEYAPLTYPPYMLAGIGLAMAVLCGLTFARMVQNRLEGWKQDRLALLPLANLETTLPYAGLVIGVTLFIGASLQVFDITGEALPPGTLLRPGPGERSFPVGLGGRAYLGALPDGRSTVHAQWLDARGTARECRFDLALPPARGDDLPDLGALLCR